MNFSFSCVTKAKGLLCALACGFVGVLAAETVVVEDGRTYTINGGVHVLDGLTVKKGCVEVIGADTVVTSAIGIADNKWGDRGGFYLRSGKVVNLASATSLPTIGSRLSYLGDGYIQIDGGRYEQLGACSWAANNMCVGAAFMQYGGESFFKHRDNGWTWYLGGGNSGSTSISQRSHAHFYVRSGLATFDSIVIQTPANDSGVASFTADGADAVIEFTKNCTLKLSACNASHTTLAANNGGTIRVAAPLVRFKTNADTPTARLLFSANGGRLQLTTDINVFGGVDDGEKRVKGVYIYEKGLIFDTNGHSTTNYAALVAPTGKGLKSVSISAEQSVAITEALGDVYGAPFFATCFDNGVSLSNDVNAEGVAEFDPITHLVTNIVITCSGWGYSQPTPYFYYGTSRWDIRTKGWATIEMQDNVGGGLVKAGEGTLTIANADNTYAGYTTLSNGVLKLGVSGALPSGNARTIRFCGGTLSAETGAEYPDDLVFDLGGLPANRPRKLLLAENWPADKQIPAVLNLPENTEIVRKDGNLILHLVGGLVLIFR